MTIKEKYAYVFLIRKYLMYELLAIGGIIIVYFGGWLFLSGKSDELNAEWLMFPVTDFLQSVLCFFLLFFIMSSSISFKTALRAKNIGKQKFWQLLRLTESMFF